MTRCRDVDRLVTLYVDGELDDRRSSALRGHLRVCARCAERVEDEARMRELAGALNPIDPPHAMWTAIEARLAEAEIGDSRRSAIWLWFQRGLDGARRNALLVGLGAAAAAVLLFWLVPGGDESEREQRAEASRRVPVAWSVEASGASLPPVRTVSRPEPAAPEPPACAGAHSHDEMVLCQMHESDRRYLDAIAELTQAVAEERADWSPTDASRFDAALAELADAASIERLRLAGQPAAAGPASRDPLYAIYRAQIDLLSNAVVAGDPMGAANRRGAP